MSGRTVEQTERLESNMQEGQGAQTSLDVTKLTASAKRHLIEANPHSKIKRVNKEASRFEEHLRLLTENSSTDPLWDAMKSADDENREGIRGKLMTKSSYVDKSYILFALWKEMEKTSPTSQPFTVDVERQLSKSIWDACHKVKARTDSKSLNMLHKEASRFEKHLRRLIGKSTDPLWDAMKSADDENREGTRGKLMTKSSYVDKSYILFALWKEMEKTNPASQSLTEDVTERQLSKSIWDACHKVKARTDSKSLNMLHKEAREWEKFAHKSLANSTSKRDITNILKTAADARMIYNNIHPDLKKQSAHSRNEKIRSMLDETVGGEAFVATRDTPDENHPSFASESLAEQPPTADVTEHQLSTSIWDAREEVEARNPTLSDWINEEARAWEKLAHKFLAKPANKGRSVTDILKAAADARMAHNGLHSLQKTHDDLSRNTLIRDMLLEVNKEETSIST